MYFNTLCNVLYMQQHTMQYIPYVLSVALIHQYIHFAAQQISLSQYHCYCSRKSTEMLFPRILLKVNFLDLDLAAH